VAHHQFKRIDIIGNTNTRFTSKRLSFHFPHLFSAYYRRVVPLVGSLLL
jgi:hypothetical protein